MRSSWKRLRGSNSVNKSTNAINNNYGTENMKQKQDENRISRRRFTQTGVSAMLASGVATALVGRASADEPKEKC